MVVHFAFLAYVVVGGFIAWRWPRAFWPHLAAAMWGGGIVIWHWTCPLTYVENWGRQQAGERGLRTGFIDHYLEGVIYPERYTGPLQFLVFSAIAISWLVLVLRLRSGRSGRNGRPGGSARTAGRRVGVRGS